jgi:hypothetical protein
MLKGPATAGPWISKLIVKLCRETLKTCEIGARRGFLDINCFTCGIRRANLQTGELNAQDRVLGNAGCFSRMF